MSSRAEREAVDEALRSRQVWRLLPALLIIGLVGCQSSPDPAEYRAHLNELIDEVIATTSPLAQLMAQGQAPSLEQVEELQDRLIIVQTELDNLGQPPTELVAAHTNLTEAIWQFQQAYDHLADNLDTGMTHPFDQEILTLAAHGGEAVHRAVAELVPAK